MLDLSWRLKPAYRPAGRPRSPSRAARLPEHPKPRICLERRPVFHRLPAALQATSDGTCVAFSQRDGAQSPMKQPRANAVSTEATEPDAPSRRPCRAATRLAWSLQGNGKRHAVRVEEPRLGWRGEIMASKQPKHEIDARWAALPALLCAAVLLQAADRQPPEKPEHIRGTVESLQDGVLTVATSTGSVPIQIEPSTPINRLVRSDRAQIAEGSYLGIVSVAQADGSRRGVEVLLFSEALRGAAEGTADWDWPGA